MRLHRRDALMAGAAGLAGAVANGVGTSRGDTGPRLEPPTIFHSPDVEPFRDGLPLLPVVTGPAVTLAARTTRHRFHRDYDPSPAFAYGGETYLGPVIEARTDEPVRLRLANRLGRHPFAADVDTTLHGAAPDHGTRPRTTLHLHGGVTPASADGHPEDFAVPGERLLNHYPNGQEATGLWYHDHSLGTTRLNVHAGLAAPYFLRDQWDTGRRDNPLGLPAGDFEIPLVLQEKIFTDGGRQSIRSTPLVPRGSWEGGAVGDRGVVNGKVWPELLVARGLYRFRLLNAGSYSVWNLHFSNRMRFWVIGNDGGLLDAPVPTRSVRMGPAERVDVVVDFDGLQPGDTVELRNDEPVPGQAAQIGEVTMPLFCRFRATRARGFTGRVPVRLRGGRRRPPRLPAVSRPRRVRNLTISQPGELRLPPSIMSLNNLRFTDPQIERPRQGTTEVWNLINVTPDPHNIHVHLVSFRILERRRFLQKLYSLAHPQPAIGTRWAPSAEPFVTGAARAPAAWEAGLKDTIRCDGHTINRLVVRWPTADELGFDPDEPFVPQGATARRELLHGSGHAVSGHDMTMPESRDHLRGYMWHCHMLDHEDHDMMLRFRLGR